MKKDKMYFIMHKPYKHYKQFPFQYTGCYTLPDAKRLLAEHNVGSNKGKIIIQECEVRWK